MSNLSDEIRISFTAEGSQLPSSHAHALSESVLARPRSTRRSPAARFAIGGLVGAAAAVVAGFVVSSLGSDGNVGVDARPHVPDSALLGVGVPGEGPPCDGAQAMVPELLKTRGSPPAYLPAEYSLNDVVSTWTCRMEGTVAVVLPRNTIVLSSPGGGGSEDQRAKRYTSFVSSKIAAGADGASMPIIQGRPAMAIPRYADSTRSIVDFEIDGTRIDVLNDGSIPIADLIKLAQSLTRIQTGDGRG